MSSSLCSPYLWPLCELGQSQDPITSSNWDYAAQKSHRRVLPSSLVFWLCATHCNMTRPSSRGRDHSIWPDGVHITHSTRIGSNLGFTQLRKVVRRDSMTDYLILTWLPELIDNIRLVCAHTIPIPLFINLIYHPCSIRLHSCFIFCPLLFLLGLSSAYVVVPSGRWLSRREDQLILSSLLFPISCSPQVATLFILFPSVTFRRGSIISFGVGLFVKSA